MNDTMESIFQEQRPFLLGLAMRILGGCADAEDVVQEAFLRWKSVDIMEVESPRAFLTTILTRLCLNHFNSARVRREIPFENVELAFNTGEEYSPEGELSEALSSAFDALLAQLSPNERVVFMLREAFEFSYDEVSRIVGLSSDNCRQLSKRARDHISRREPRFNPAPGQEERALETFLQACQTGDFSELIHALSDDVELCRDSDDETLPTPTPIVGLFRVANALPTFFGSGASFTTTEFYSFGDYAILLQEGEKKRATLLRLEQNSIRNITVIKCPNRLRRMNVLLNACTTTPIRHL